MTPKELDIIQSLLVQFAGPINYRTMIGVEIEDFYPRWRKYVSDSIKNLDALSNEEKLFLIQIVDKITKKLDWEAETVTGYSDEEIAESNKVLKEYLKLSPPFEDNLLANIPQALR